MLFGWEMFSVVVTGTVASTGEFLYPKALSMQTAFFLAQEWDKQKLKGPFPPDK